MCLPKMLNYFRPRNDEDTPGTTDSIRDYYYVTEWRDKLVDSSQFYVRHGHENPK